jgi:hypothetical protein
MRGTLAVVTSLLTFVVAWIVAGVIVWLALPSADNAILGRNAGLIVEKIIVWLVGPGAGAYYALTLTKKWFRDVNGETIFVGFLAVFLTLITVMLAFNVLMLLGANPYNSSWLEAAGVMAQSAAAVFGALLAKREFPASQQLTSGST